MGDSNIAVESDDSEEINDLADSAANEVLPEKSKDRYLKVYNDFEKWKKRKKSKGISEKNVLAYFFEMSKSMKPSSLWAQYSMLKATMKVKDNIDIAKYNQISAFLKTKSSGYKPMKAKIFSEAEIKKFIVEAPDNDWLDVKVFSLHKIYVFFKFYLFTGGLYFWCKWSFASR